MSNLLEQASLVMIPSGYKEDIVYSVIPTSGAGDLTFTRASNGTRIDSNGNVEVVPWNLLQYSEDFSNGAWSKINATVTSNTTTAPNGTTTADTLEKLGGSGGLNYYYIVQNTNSFEQLTNFFYVKHKSGSGIVWILGLNSGTFAFFDVINGTALSKSSGMTTSIESVGNGWYKCIVSQNYQGASSTTYGIGLCLVDGTPNYDATSAATQSVYIWGAQSAVGTTSKPYFPTTDRLNVPRLTYQNGGGGCPSLLLEKQSTNISNQSEDFASWPTQVNVTPTANYATSPDGTQNADRIQFTGAGFMYGANGYSQTSGVVYTLSCWAKRNGSGSQSVGFFVDGSGTINSAWSLSSEYQRFTYTYTAGNSSLVGIAGASGADVSVWGWQFEASSYATSYIPTTSSSATRVADACYKTGISSLIGQTSGTVFVDYTAVSTNPGGRAITINDYPNTAYNNRIAVINESNVIRVYISSGGVLQYDGSFGAFIGHHKVAIAYASNDLKIYIDGVEVASQSSSFTPPTCSVLSVGTFENNTSDYPIQGQINQAIVFPTRLTNSELAQLTGNQNYTINQAYESYGVASESPNCVQP